MFVASPAEPKSKSRRPRTAFLAACFLCAAAFLGGFFPITDDYLWDEAVYLSMAENLWEPDPYYEEFSFRPPFFPILIRLGSTLVPLELSARLLTSLSLAAGVLFLFLLGQRLYNARAGLFAAGLMTASPFFLHWTHKVMTDVCSTSFAIISMYFLVRHLEAERPAPASSFVAGAMLGVSTITRFVLVLTAVCALSLFLLHRARLRSALWYSGGFLTAMGPYFIWAQIEYGGFLEPLIKAVSIASGEPVLETTYYLVAIPVVSGPLAMLGLLCYGGAVLAHGNERWTTTDVPLWVWHLSFLAYLTVTLHKEVRYILPGIPPLFLLAGWGFSRLASRGARVAGLAAATVVALFLLGNLRYFDGSAELDEEYLLNRSAETCAAARYLRGRLLPEDTIYSATLYPLAAYCSKQRTVALSPPDDRFYGLFPRNMRQNGYLIIYKDVPKAPSREWLGERSEFEPLREFGNVVVYKYTSGLPPPAGR